jgi:S-adenosylmethionine hydrolase
VESAAREHPPEQPLPEHPIVTLLTDWSTRDGYVGAVRGVVLSRSGRARIVDITHDIEPGDVRGAGRAWATAASRFPVGTIHVGVVDPGVGGTRRIVAAKTARGHIYLAPDNGILSFALERREIRRVVAVERRELFLATVSDTFHGRDIFAPVAAALAEGLAIDELGPRIDPSSLVWPSWPRARRRRGPDGVVWRGEIIHVDRFGNCATNLAPPPPGARLALEVAGHTLRRIERSYDAVDAGSPLLIVGSDDRIEIAVSRGAAARSLGLEIGSTVRLTVDTAVEG